MHEGHSSASQLLLLSPLFGQLVTMSLAELPRSDRLSPPQMRALGVLIDHPGINVSQFAAAMGVATPTASVMATRMAATGLVDRGESQGRNVELRPSARGRAIFGAVAESMARRLVAALKEDEAERIAETLPLVAAWLVRATR